MKPFVSVIVPIYDVEKYLTRCMDSLCRQSLREIEIILVNDASPDCCGDICETYAAKDERFKVVHHLENKGLSEARNTGIQTATADYLMFVDSDDWVHEDFCKDAYECAVYYQADLVMFRFQTVNKKVSKSPVLLNSNYKTTEEALDLLENGLGNVAWNKIYRKDLFEGIIYPPGRLAEDTGTTYRLVLQSNHIYYLDKVLYYHYQRKGSISTLRNRKVLCDMFEMSMQKYCDLKTWNYPTDKLNTYLIVIALNYCLRKRPDFNDKHYVFCEKVLQACTKIPDAIKMKKKILLVLFKYCRPLFEGVCLLYKTKMC